MSNVTQLVMVVFGFISPESMVFKTMCLALLRPYIYLTSLVKMATRHIF